MKRRPRRNVLGYFSPGGFRPTEVVLECGHRTSDRTGRSALCQRCVLGEPPEFSKRDKMVQVQLTVTVDQRNAVLPLNESGEAYTQWVLGNAADLIEQAMKGKGKMGVEMLDLTFKEPKR